MERLHGRLHGETAWRDCMMRLQSFTTVIFPKKIYKVFERATCMSADDKTSRMCPSGNAEARYCFSPPPAGKYLFAPSLRQD